jgi:putative ABC transport system permease protein
VNAPAYRAAVRVASRQARRAPWRSALVAVLVALPVAGLAGAAVVIRTAVPTPEELVRGDMGSADLTMFPSRILRAEELSAHLPPGSTVVDRRERFSSNVVEGRSIQTSLIELSAPADGPLTAGMFHLLAGRLPTSPGEAALQPDVLDDYGAEIGGRIRFAGLGLTVTVTGTVVEPEHLSVPLALLGPGTFAFEDVPTPLEAYLVGLPSGASPSQAAARLSSLTQVEVATRESVLASAPWGRTIATGGSFAAAAVALFGTGLIAAAAFVVGARRQLRTLGLMSAAGAEPRHVRTTVLLGGTVLGFIGSSVGVAIGIGASFAIHPYLDPLAGRIVGPVRVPVLPLLGALALGTAASTLAAHAPARAAAKLSTVEALAGRTSPPKSPGRLAAAGLMVAVAGGAVVAWATKTHSDGSLALGLITMLSGVLVGIPLTVTWIGRGAGHLPTAPRIAARDLARHGRRTAAALAAATIALALPVGVGALTLSQDAYERQVPFMAADNLSIGFFDGMVKPRPGDGDRLVEDLRAALPGSIVVQLRTAASTESGKQRQIWVKGPLVRSQGQLFRGEGDLVIGDADVLRAFHAEQGIPALASGKIVAVGPGSTDAGVVHLATHLGDDPNVTPGATDLPAVEAGSTRYASLGSGEYNYVISSDAAARLGLVVSEASESNPLIVLRAPTDLSDDDIQHARDVVARYRGASVNAEADLGSHNGPGRWIFGIAGTILALAIVAIVVALIGAESRKDRAILAAVGAAPRTRRALAGASAWVVAAVAGAIAVPAGFAPVVVYRMAQARDYPIVVPWAAIAVAIVLVPVIAGAAAAAGSREPRPMSLLRPIA